MHVKTIVPKTESLLYRNFPDFEPPKIEASNKMNSSKIKIVYAGLLGVAQGVLKLCENLDFSNIEFHIYGSVPSKIFEYSRLGLPIIYFGGGEGEKLVEKHQLGWIAEAGNYTALNETISTLKASDFDLNFRRKIQETATTRFDTSSQLKALQIKI